jgi:uncharacterized protein
MHCREVAERFLLGARRSHDWEHTLRVARLCQRIGPAEGADMEVLMTAAYLHDIGRQAEDETGGRVCHAREGARMAAEALAGLDLSEEQKDNVLHCIRTHRFRDRAAPETVEARVLFDADKLDAIGAVGIARAYMFAGEVGARLHNPDNNIEATRAYSEDDTGYREYMVKLRKIKDRMLTATGRRMAEQRHRFMVRFFDQLAAEHECES